MEDDVWMLNIFMRNYLKGWLESDGIFVCFGKYYVWMKPLVQAGIFGQSVLESYKGCCLK